MGDTGYAEVYRGRDFRKEPQAYPIGRGEQGVLLAEPYKSELLPLWRFRTVPIAEESARALTEKFHAYLGEGDFVGADMARKFLQMGWTRARRYANHAGGNKYDEDGGVRPQLPDALTSEKAEAARIFKQAYDEARQDPTYLALKKSHKVIHRQWLKAQDT